MACTLLQLNTPQWDMLYWTSLAFQPKSRERSAHLRGQVTFAPPQQKSAYPAHTRELDEDEDDKPLDCPDGTTASEDEDDKLLVQPASR